MAEETMSIEDLKTAHVISLETWRPDKSFDDCVRICISLGLLDTVKHGENDYVRVTQTGINVVRALMRLANEATDPANVLKES